MSAPAFGWALERGATLALRPSDRLVLLYLADMANGLKVCWPGQPLIERYTGLKNNTVRAAINRLAALQLIRVEGTPGKLTRYHILRPDTPANGTGVTPANEHRGTPANGDGVPPQSGTGHPLNCGGGPPQKGALTPANGHTDPFSTQVSDPKRRASAPEAGKILSFPEKQEARTPTPGPPTQATTPGSSLPVPEDDNPPVDPGVVLAELESLRRSMRMTAYPPRAAAMSADEQIAEIAPRRPKPNYLPDDALAALRADARRSLARRAVVS